MTTIRDCPGVRVEICFRLKPPAGRPARARRTRPAYSTRRPRPPAESVRPGRRPPRARPSRRRCCPWPCCPCRRSSRRPTVFPAAAFLAESPPSSCSTAEGLPVVVSPLMPSPRRVRSIAGRAFSSALVLSVIRNSRNALRCTIAFARPGSVMPASSTTIRSSPGLLHQGLLDPELVDALAQHGEREIEVPLGIGRHLLRLIELEGEVHAALEVEAALERDPGDHGVAHDPVAPAFAQGDGPGKRK